MAYIWPHHFTEAAVKWTMLTNAHCLKSLWRQEDEQRELDKTGKIGGKKDKKNVVDKAWEIRRHKTQQQDYIQSRGSIV